MEDLKPCPFCGSSQIEITKEHIESQNSMYPGHESLICRCNSCDARTGGVIVDFFNSFSDYTVKEFRQNNALRAKEEDRYDEYLEEKRSLAIEQWNRRSVSE
jgi:transcription elongation factor Elf1